MSPRPVFAGVAVVLGLLATVVPAQVPSPEEVLGKPIGADYFLADYTQLRNYWERVAAHSDRMVLEPMGETSYGQEMVLAVITSPENHRRRERLRSISERLGRARGVPPEQAEALAAEGTAVVWIDGGLHATETVAGQNIIELVHRMTSRDDPEVREILDNVVLLVCPANPDGMEMVARAYMATERIRVPVLYQRYVGHDNNRDFYMANQPEAEHINRMLYWRWYPQIVYNHHQSAPRGTILFTPPFRDPFNYRYDPLVVRGIEIVAAHMNRRFSSEDKPGVISRSGASYSTWWNGGLRTTVYFHNMIGILTEAYGSPTPGRVTQRLRRRLPYTDYPDPVPSQEWHARQTIEYLQTANFAILTYAARFKDELLRDFHRMGRNSIERGSRDHWTPTPRLLELAEAAEEGSAEGDAADVVFSDPELRDPRGYVLPADQADFTAAVRFARALQKCGIEVHRATADFAIGGVEYPEGSLVVRCDQAFRPHVLDMFEPQWHPDDRGQGGQPVRPYDSAGWTVAYQMDVRFDRILEGFDGPFEPVDWAEFPEGRVTGAAEPAGWLVDHRDLHSYTATNRLLAAGMKVGWRTGAVDVEGWEGRPGDVWIPAGVGVAARIAALAGELGVDFHGVAEEPAGETRWLRPRRIGLFDVWGGNMSTGWAQWALKEFDFPVELVFGKRVREGALREDYDVLMFFTGLPGGRDLRRARRRRPVPDDYVQKLQEALPPFEDWSHLPDRAVRLTSEDWDALRQFVADGGTLIAVDDEGNKVLRAFDLAAEPGPMRRNDDGERRRVPRSEFFVPGSLLAVAVDTDHPVGYGVSERLAVMFRRSPVFSFRDGASPDGLKAVARYAENDLLLSGWAIGEDHARGGIAALHAEVGDGDIHLFGPDVMYRGQPHGTFKLVFNAILAADPD